MSYLHEWHMPGGTCNGTIFRVPLNKASSSFPNLDACTDPESFVRGVPTLTFFLVDAKREDPNTTISGPSSAQQQNAIKWRFAGVPIIAQH